MLRDLEATLQANAADGRLALSALLGDRRLRVYADGRIDGAVWLEHELAAPRTVRAAQRSRKPVA